MSQEVFSKVKSVIIDKLQWIDESEIILSAYFKEDLEADSLDKVELVMEFENEFNITIPDESIETILTVEDAVNVICEEIEIKNINYGKKL